MVVRCISKYPERKEVELEFTGVKSFSHSEDKVVIFKFQTLPAFLKAMKILDENKIKYKILDHILWAYNIESCMSHVTKFKDNGIDNTHVQ